MTTHVCRMKFVNKNVHYQYCVSECGKTILFNKYNKNDKLETDIDSICLFICVYSFQDQNLPIVPQFIFPFLFQVIIAYEVVVVVRLPRPMEGNGATPIFRSLQNCQFHHRRLESLEHFNVLYIYIYIYIYIAYEVETHYKSRMHYTYPVENTYSIPL